ncbi:MAG: endolytic transglycosylase MltG [Patescibacteria group bacterium]
MKVPEFLKDKRNLLVTVVLILFFLLIFILTPPWSFPSKSIITISEGTGLSVLSMDLEETRVIRSPFWFRTFAIVLGGERNMKAGQYYLSRPLNTFTIAWRIFHGHYDVETIKITIPEGFTVKKISNLFDERFTFFDHQAFEFSAPEGYLFPDTYFVQVTATATSTIKMLNDNFTRKIDSIKPALESSDKTLDEIITMASILEGEARGLEDMAIVSGILWKRLEHGIALQVDTSFVYVNGKTTKELTSDDLKIKSPYNTYLYRGLPPTPISNPGLSSIEAALNPTTTPYLYFLTGDDGEMYYSKTFDEHVEKKRKYIK